MNTPHSLSLSLTTAAAIAISAAFPLIATARDRDVKLDTLPVAVQKTITEQTAGGKITEIDQEDEKGTVFYEIDFKKGKRRMEFKVAENGKLLTQPQTAVERVAQRLRDKASGVLASDLRLDQLPAEVQAAVKKETAGGKITEIEGEKEDGLMFYEVEFEKDGEDYEITVDQTGKVVNRDDD